MPTQLRSRLAAGIFLALAGGGAQASICDGALCGSGELFLNVWNQGAATSYSLDLGVKAVDVANGTVGSFSRNLADSSVAPLFGSFLSALQSGTALKYNVAADNVNGTVQNNAYYGVLTTIGDSTDNVQNVIKPTVSLNQISGTMNSNVRSRVTNLNQSAANSHGGSAGPVSSNLDEVSQSTDASYYADSSWGSDLGGALGGTVTDADTGHGLDLYLIGWGHSRQTTRFDLLGHFTLANNGLLTFGPGAAPAAVPVPAAGWLMLPALLPLLRNGRRRDAIARG